MLRERKVQDRSPPAHRALGGRPVAREHGVNMVDVVQRAGQPEVVAPKVRHIRQQHLNHPVLPEIKRRIQPRRLGRAVHVQRLCREFQARPAGKALFPCDDMQRVGVA